MRNLLSILVLSALFFALHANAILITDTYVVERQIPSGGGEGHIFELINAGYSPTTDSITYIRLIYDFTEIYSPTNEGDTDQYNENFPDDGPQYQDEFVIFSSWIFNWREVDPDIDTGLTIFERSWVRNDYCQITANAIPGDDETGYCMLNLDVAGTMNAYVRSYTDNLWLHSIRVEIEVDRTLVPESGSALLLGIGLFTIGFLRNRKLRHLKATTLA